MRHPAYDLKVNKEADRAVMIETIRRSLALLKARDEAYTYVGFGGPFLEDMKRMSSVFPRMKLVSIESNAQTFARQEYHRFVNSSKLELINAHSRHYFRNIFAPTDGNIVWLDYLSFGKDELNEFVYLATILPPGSMLRITIKGEWRNSLPALIGEDADWEEVFQGFRDEFQSLAPEKLHPEDFVDGDAYCTLLCEMIMKAVDDEVAPPLPRYFQPLVANYYKDETRMFSLMGIISPTPAIRNQKKVNGKICDRRVIKAFEDWDLSSLDGKSVHQLHVPTLSVRERWVIDKHLPFADTDAGLDECLNELPYSIGNSRNDSRRLIKRYATVAGYYSQFVRVAS